MEGSLIGDSSFVYMVLVLPALFGLTLIGEGLNKIMNYDNRGWISTITGVLFMAVVIFAFFFIKGV